MPRGGHVEPTLLSVPLANTCSSGLGHLGGGFSPLPSWGRQGLGRPELCAARLLLRAPQRPALHPAVPLTTLSFLNPCGKDDKESPCRAEPQSGARHEEVTSTSPKRQVSQRKHDHSQTS